MATTNQMNLRSVTNGNILLRELKLGFLCLKGIFNFFFIVFLYHKLETLDGYIMVFSLKDAHFRCTFHVKDPLIFEYSESKRVDWVCVQNRLRSKSDISTGQKGLLGHHRYTTLIIYFGSRFSS